MWARLVPTHRGIMTRPTVPVPPFGYSMPFSGCAPHRTRGSILPFCLIITATVATVLLVDLELLRRSQSLPRYAAQGMAFHVGMHNVMRQVRAELPRSTAELERSFLFNNSCSNGYCFFGTLSWGDEGLRACRYQWPAVSVARNESLWRDPRTHRSYRVDDVHRAARRDGYSHRVITEFLCTHAQATGQLPLYRTLIRLRVDEQARTERTVQAVHGPVRVYDWQELVY